METVSLLTSAPSASPGRPQTSLCVGCEGVRFDSHLSTFQRQAGPSETKGTCLHGPPRAPPTAVTRDSAFRLRDLPRTLPPDNPNCWKPNRVRSTRLWATSSSRWGNQLWAQHARCSARSCRRQRPSLQGCWSTSRLGPPGAQAWEMSLP